MKHIKSAILFASLFLFATAALSQTNKPAHEKQLQVMHTLHLMKDSTIANVVMDHIVSNDHLRAMMIDKLEKFEKRDPQATEEILKSILGEAGKSSSENSSTEILIKFKLNAKAEQINAMASEMGLQEVKKIPELGLQVYRITSGKSVTEVVEHCEKHAFVEYAEPNYTYKALK